VGLIPATAPGATPLDPDEARGLIPTHITTQGQLNEWELQNIVEGRVWASRLRGAELLTVVFMQKLHYRMFGRTWRWAGQIRGTEKNIGVEPAQILVPATEVCRDVDAQLQHRVYPVREIAARFHHRLVLIHPFPNGNGRFARAMADLLLTQRGEPPFAWGEDRDAPPHEIRQTYIAALRAADAHDYRPLLAFLRLSDDAPQEPR
jgi:Fic-DOC domain mobile mystery protein B